MSFVTAHENHHFAFFDYTQPLICYLKLHSAWTSKAFSLKECSAGFVSADGEMYSGTGRQLGRRRGSHSLPAANVLSHTSVRHEGGGQREIYKIAHLRSDVIYVETKS